ncbi:MAG TPA: glycoside hydrolase family 9 protein [Gemmatimonadaceae bacterium]|nr:glycoside hydrolase family 9 protein [Gemmatimonadaceae bacterium]
MLTRAAVRRTLCLAAFNEAAAILFVLAGAASAQAQAPGLMPIPTQNSAEWGWLKKPVLASRLLDDMTVPASWTFQGTGRISFTSGTDGIYSHGLRVDMDMFTDKPAPTRNGLSSVNLKRAFPGEDWSAYNRISMWIRPTFSGIPAFPIQIVLHNDGKVKVPDAYYREGIHYVTLTSGEWQHVVWEITPLARDKVTMIELGYWVNKMLAQPDDHVSFEIGKIELERVVPDNYEGWSVGPRKIAVSHSGYRTNEPKTAIASGTRAREFTLLRRVGDKQIVPLQLPTRTLTTRLGAYQLLDFSSVRVPGRYMITAGNATSKWFDIGGNVWDSTIWKTLNFFYGERCGMEIPGVHGDDHRDWFATLGDQKIVMNGGWHDAGDLSQGLINTGEATYAMFALAESMAKRGGDPALVKRLIDEARWGLYWVMKVRFPGGYRISFASHNLWTDNIAGNADDRSREAKNNPNANYIAAAAEAIAYRLLRDADSETAARALQLAEEDWTYAIAGREGPDTWHTPAFAATPIELAGIGILASIELYKATEKKLYADKAIELARIILASQQKTYVGSKYPLAGFFYTGPDRDTIFHQFHRGNDQAPIVALAKLAETFPNHADWMKWYSTVAFYSEYQKAGARTTEPYGVLPAYVYTDREYLQRPEKGALHMETREAFQQQVLQGMAMGDGYYLRAFPVWFARRGNYGILLSQAKALSAAARLRHDKASEQLAEKQAQWIVGRNPFAQSTMYGEGYDFAQQYSVSSGDFVGSLPVGMQSWGITDRPYWPSQNMYVYKEVWVHPSARWLWLMEDLTDPSVADVRTARTLDYSLSASSGGNGRITLRLIARGTGRHTFAVRSENLSGPVAAKTLNLKRGAPETVEWTVRATSMNQPWVAVAIPDGDVANRREAFGIMGTPDAVR